MLRQFFAAPSTGGDGDGACAERFSAGDIARRVADDVDLVRGKFAAVLVFGAGAGKCTELIPIVVVVGEGAKFKEMPDTVVAEFELCAACDLAGKEPEDEVFSRFQLFKQFEHAGQ